MGNIKKYMKYVEENLVDDQDDVYTIIKLAGSELERMFDISKDCPEMLITIFSVTFRTIIKKLQERSTAGYPRYAIIIANRVEIGYGNTENKDYEKNGGFVFYMKHLYKESKENDDYREYGDTSIERCMQWNSINIVTDSKFINEVASEAIPEIKKLDLKLESQEAIMPIFCFIYDAITSYMTNRLRELKEFEFNINFASLFDVKAYNGQTEDGSDTVIITFTPAIEFKLGLKSDASASAKYDDV